MRRVRAIQALGALGLLPSPGSGLPPHGRGIVPSTEWEGRRSPGQAEHTPPGATVAGKGPWPLLS